jgi:hypothetical protein
MGEPAKTNPEVNSVTWMNDTFIIIEQFNDKGICVWISYVKQDGTAFTDLETKLAGAINGVDVRDMHSVGSSDDPKATNMRNSELFINKDTTYGMITSETNAFGNWKSVQIVMTGDGLRKN